jgi:prepilin-type N-terminal cleavage/methylation domain-containing protein/prepilin-type processing-associated H-X9-DG protein
MARRNAFSLVELLVTITIIGVLIALLLPAVQAARESVRRLHCGNNLKQIALAVQSYHEACGVFPPGNYAQTAGVCPGQQPADTPSEDRANWLIAILPHLEQQSLHGLYDPNAPNESAVNRAVRDVSVPCYVCPSDVDSTKPVVPEYGPASPAMHNVPYMPGSYRGVSGRSDGNRFLDSGLSTNYPRLWRGPLHVVGILGYRSESYNDIRDGTSNTLLAGESTTRTNPGFRTLWAYSFAYYSLSAITPQSRTLLGDFDLCVQIGGSGQVDPCLRGWGSLHPHGLNFAFCDGSVRFVPLDIDLNLLADLATIDGGETTQLP